MSRPAIAAMILCTLTACATPTPPVAMTPKCFNAKVMISTRDGSGHLVAPGIPIDVVVRSKQGRILKALQSDSEGRASFEVCWNADDPAWQVEAQLRFGPQFVGTFASFTNTSDTYCLTLPDGIGGHCGEWGTGPGKLLSPEADESHGGVQ